MSLLLLAFLALAFIFVKTGMGDLGLFLITLSFGLIFVTIYEEIYSLKYHVEIPVQLYNELDESKIQLPELSEYIQMYSKRKKERYVHGEYNSYINYSAYLKIIKSYNTAITTKENKALQLEINVENKYSEIKTMLKKHPTLKNISSNIEEISNNSKIYNEICHEYWFLDSENCTNNQLKRIDGMVNEYPELNEYVNSSEVKGKLKASRFQGLLDRYEEKKLQSARDSLFGK